MRNAFLGSNTPDGFFSYYSSILHMGDGARLFILKGGSGTGKSTLMKRVIEFADSVGVTAEAYHCSSDSSSLDGVLLPELKMAVVDGTAPHVVDCTAYGAFEEIVDLGEAVDKAKVAAKCAEIETLLRYKASCYKSAYAYIGGAGKLYFDTAEKYRTATDPVKVNAMALSVTGGLELKRKETGVYGNRRKLFMAALTPGGYTDYTAELLEAGRAIVLKNGFDSVAADVLERKAPLFYVRMRIRRKDPFYADLRIFFLSYFVGTAFFPFSSLQPACAIL